MSGENGHMQMCKFGWFGYPDLTEEERVPTPVGKPCMYCQEVIVEGDLGIQFLTGYVQHRECGFRAVIGSVAHLEGRCSCFVDESHEGDPEGMTLREGALAAWQWAVEHDWFANQGGWGDGGG